MLEAINLLVIIIIINVILYQNCSYTFFNLHLLIGCLHRHTMKLFNYEIYKSTVDIIYIKLFVELSPSILTANFVGASIS